MAKTADVKCYDLARHFLQDEATLNTKEHEAALAMVIQTAIEDWIEDEKWERRNA